MEWFATEEAYQSTTQRNTTAEIPQNGDEFVKEEARGASSRGAIIGARVKKDFFVFQRVVGVELLEDARGGGLAGARRLPDRRAGPVFGADARSFVFLLRAWDRGRGGHRGRWWRIAFLDEHIGKLNRVG